MDKKLQVYKKYFETAKDYEHLVMHRGYALKLVQMVEQQQQEIKKLNNEIGGYSGKVIALSEELSFLSGRLNKLQKEMIGQD